MKERVPPPQTPSERPTLAEVFRMHASYVVHSLRRLGVRTADLEDVAHDVFLVVDRKLPDYQPDRPIKPWLFGVAARVAVAYRRRAGHVREILSDEVELLAGETAGAENDLELEQRRRLVHTALRSVAPERREVLILHDLDGVAMPEVTAALGIPLNTGYSRLRLARQELRDALHRLTRRETP